MTVGRVISGLWSAAGSVLAVEGGLVSAVSEKREEGEPEVVHWKESQKGDWRGAEPVQNGEEGCLQRRGRGVVLRLLQRRRRGLYQAYQGAERLPFFGSWDGG